MKKTNQLFPANRLITLLVMCLTLFVAVSCDDDEDETPTIAAPTLNDASAVTATGFTTSWAAVTGAEKYLLDVSTVNTFATTVTGYNKKEITGAVTTPVTGLTASTKYYFRVYSKKGTVTSVASTVKEVTTTP